MSDKSNKQSMLLKTLKNSYYKIGVKLNNLSLTLKRKVRKPISIGDQRYSNCLKKRIEIFSGKNLINRNNFCYPPKIKYKFEKKEILLLKDVLIWPSCSLVCVNRHPIIETGFNSYRLNNVLKQKYKYLGKEITVNKPCTVIDCAWIYHYHWLIDILPRLYSLHHPNFRQEKEILLLFTRQLNKVEFDSIVPLLPNNVKIKYIKPDIQVKANNFIWLPYLSGDSSAYLPTEYLTWFKGRIFNHLNINQNGRGTEYIYISRKKAKKRMYTNEKELIFELKKLGFTTYVLEEMDFYQQVKLFNNAKIIFGLIGAGLTNIIFSPKCKVLVHDIGIAKPHYRWLSKAIGHNYLNFLSADVGKNDNFKAPINEIIKNLEKAISLDFE